MFKTIKTKEDNVLENNVLRFHVHIVTSHHVRTHERNYSAWFFAFTSIIHSVFIFSMVLPATCLLPLLFSHWWWIPGRIFIARHCGSSNIVIQTYSTVHRSRNSFVLNLELAYLNGHNAGSAASISYEHTRGVPVKAYLDLSKLGDIEFSHFHFFFNPAHSSLSYGSLKVSCLSSLFISLPISATPQAFHAFSQLIPNSANSPPHSTGSPTKRNLRGEDLSKIFVFF